MLLTILILYVYIYKKEGLKIKKLVILMLSIVFFGSWMNLYRSGYAMNSDLLKTFIHFFEDQGVSLLVLIHYIDFKDQFTNNGVSFIFAPIIDFLLSIKHSNIHMQTEEGIRVYKNLALQLSYFLNKELFLKGYGIGGNFLAEFYEFLNLRLFGVAIWSFFSGYFIPKLFEILKKTKIGLIFLFLNLGYITYISRSCLFRFDYSFTTRICFLYILFNLFKCFLFTFLLKKEKLK